MEHVPRERNQVADMLSHLTTAGYEIPSDATVVEWFEEEAFWTKEVMNNDALEGEGGHGALVLEGLRLLKDRGPTGRSFGG
ncbi:hypothetical protein LIER_42462 [Lithospermum erythrorhizon]|uniref:RNase H type-1 domain-containing protein n=1 Tax=Lithospermum erythrorhizon TaxID=34254 RepID=A0AAV3RU00_LITER